MSDNSPTPEIPEFSPFTDVMSVERPGCHPAARNALHQEDEMQSTYLPSPIVRRNGNGARFPAPTSRRAFIKSAPRRLGTIEDQLEAHEHRLDAISGLLGSEARDPRTAAIETRLDNLVEIVGCLAARLDRIDKRSARSRNKVAALVDRVEASFE